MAAKSKLRRPVASTHVDARVRLEDPARVVQKGIIKWAAYIAGSLVLAGSAWTAYNALGLPKVATYEYVGNQIKEAVQPIASKVDSQGIYILSGRIEVLKSSRQQQITDRNRLDLLQRSTKDVVAVQIIVGQQKTIDDVVKSIDSQIVDLSTQLKALQDGKH